MQRDGDRITAIGEVYNGGDWNLALTGFKDKLMAGDLLEWQVNYSLELDDPETYMDRMERVTLVLAARRLCDAEGHYKDQDGYFTSTYLTPSGLPVDGFQTVIANSTIGGPYKTPLDHAVEIPLEDIQVTQNGLAIETPVHHRLIEDFPAGRYRFELAFYASVDGHWYLLHVLPAIFKEIAVCDMDFESYFFQKIMLPPVGIGEFKQPRMIWTLFSELNSNGISGVVANEDAPYFAMSNRVKLQGKYILPCKPDHRTCKYRIEPNLPTIDRGALLQTKSYDYQPLELDWSKSKISVSVKKPDSTVNDLGTHTFRMKLPYGPRTFSNDLKYEFDQFGMYEIRMTGEVFDYYGNRYEAGGTYEVWIAYPLSFATGIKPANPLRVGGFYSPAATINPPVPADVTATVRFFPGTHPQDVLETVYTGKAQRFGYFFPDVTQPMLRFPEQGEFLFDIFATYTDKRGRVYMGNMKNASVVLSDTPSMTVKGLANTLPDQIPRIAYPLGREYLNTHPIQFPNQSGDMMYFFGNSRKDDMINPAMGVEEPTGALQETLDRHFPIGLYKLNNRPGLEYAFTEHADVFAGSQEGVRYSGYMRDTEKTTLLMSTTSKGYSPFEYPELVNRRGYYYIATSRPGFPVYFVVADSTIFENYWYTGRGNYAQTIGAGIRGDQPGDVYWSLVTALFTDHEDDQEYYGIYGSGGVAHPMGSEPLYYGPPFELPVASINGTDLYIYGGVGPSPGTMYETGAIKGVGSIAVPMVPHEAEINIHKPDGSVHACRGRADEIGNFFCPSGPLVFDQAGVYKVYSKFWEGTRAGTCVGARNGWYSVYAVEKDSPYNVLFDPAIAGPVAYDEPFVIRGKVTPALSKATAYYSVVSPGILMDEGSLKIEGDHFQFSFTPSQFGSQFPNLFEHPGLVNDKPPAIHRKDLGEFIENFFTGVTEKKLSDTIEITIFVEGYNEQGALKTAGGKFVLRGNRAIVPERFMANSGRTIH